MQLCSVHLLNIVLLAVAGGLFGLCGSERADELLIGTRPPPPPLFPSLISLMVSVDVKHHDYRNCRAQQLCESRGGRPGLPSLINQRFLWT